MKFSNLHRLLIVCLFSLFWGSRFSSAAESAIQEPARKAARPLPLQNSFSEQSPQVEVVADTLEYDKKQNKIIAKGNVVVRHESTQLTSDYAEVQTETKQVYAKGHVVIFRNGEPISNGDEIQFDFENQTGSFPEGRVITVPWIIKGQDMRQVKKGVKVLQNADITTCDFEKPHYYIRAKKVTIYDGDKMVARNIKIYALDVPIFWWPYFIVPLGQNNLPFNVTAGNNSRHGAYIEITKGLAITKDVGAKAHLDWRSKRGVGGGADVYYDFNELDQPKILGNGIIKGYLTQDKRAPTPSLANPYSELEDRARGRLTWLHRTDFDPYTNVLFRYNRLADEYFLQDFFRKESRAEIEPQSFATFTKNSENFGFLTHVEKKMNSFEAMVERLPEVRFDWKTQRFFDDHVFYDSQISYSNLHKTFTRASYDEDVSRYDTIHEWSLPLQWQQFKLTPYVDLRGTYYSRDRESSENQFRSVFNPGIDLRTQAYRTYDVSFDTLGIEVNQLRHVIEPSIQYKLTTSSVSDETLNHFDSIDTIDDADMVTLGVENRLQTKRMVRGRIQRVDLVSLNTFLSYELRPDGRSLGSTQYPAFQDGRTSSNFTVASQEVILRPYEWLQTQTRFDIDVPDQQMRVFNQDFIAKTGRFKLLFGYRYQRQYQDVPANDAQYVFDINYTINSLWAIGGYTRWTKSTLEEWQLTASRDLHDFIFDFGYNVRDSDIDSSNRELFFNFRMKNFPEYAVRSGHRASFAEPRIGETVTGANQDQVRTTETRPL